MSPSGQGEVFQRWEFNQLLMGKNLYYRIFNIYLPKIVPCWLECGIKGKPKKSSPGQMRLPWDNQKVTESTEVEEVAKIFIEANCYNPPVPGIGTIEC